MKVVYSSLGKCPPEYYCHNCKITGYKLWRLYNSFNVELFCAICASEKEKIDISDMNDEGVYTNDLGKAQTIGYYVPAIPDEEEIGFWGYTSVPLKGVKWWLSLKTKREENVS